MLLAQLFSHRLIANGGGVPLGAEDLSEDLDRTGVGTVGHEYVEPLLYESHPALGEFPHRVLAAGFGQEPQGLNREVVVLLVETLSPVLGQSEQFGWTPTTSRRVVPRLSSLDVTLLDELIQVPTYGGRGELEPLREGRGGGRSLHEDRPNDALPRCLVSAPGSVLVEFHNTSVPLMVQPFQVR